MYATTAQHRSVRSKRDCKHNGLQYHSDFAIRTLWKALASQPSINGGLILHSDQGSQYISKAFGEFCESANVTQSISKA